MQLLSGIKVIDVTAWAFVPSAGGVLAHWGADVIKIENPTSPDPMRLLGGSLEPGAASTQFKHYSRGKRSVGLNLADPEGRDLLYRLAADADVFLTSYLPETRRKLRIDVDDMRAVNPGIVYARGSGQGPHGPDAERPAYDMITWWCRGSLAQSAMDGSGAPWPTMMVGHGDGMAGMTLAGGICAALLHRAMTGEAPVVDGSLMGAAVWFNGPELIASQFRPRERTFQPAPPAPGSSAMPATMGSYQTKDYRFLYLCFLGDADADFVDLCEHLDIAEIGADDRFAGSAARVEHRAELREIFEKAFASRTFAQWKQELAHAKGAWGPVQTPEEVYDDPQTAANGFLRTVSYPTGPLTVPVPPILFNGDAGDPPPAPDFLAHTEEVLATVGVDGDELDRLRAAGAVG